LPVVARRHGERGDAGGAAHQHDIEDGEGEEGGMGLRHIGDARGALPARPGGQRLSVEQDLAGLDGQQAEHGLE